MSAIVINKTVNLNATVRETLEDDLTFTGEKNAHKFVIAGIRNGSPVNLSGTVTAQFICPDNATVPINGAIEGGKATVTLSDECYEVPGRFRLSIFNTDGGATVCIYSAVGTVRRTTTNRVVNRGTIPNLNELQQAARNITGVEHIDITQTKSGNVITVTTTNRNNVKTNKTITEPTAVVSKDENGPYRLTVKDANGTTGYEIPDPASELKKKANLEAVTVKKTVGPAEMVSFEDGVDAPAVLTKIKLEPKQDLHGYDHPWVGGAGKNLCPVIFSSRPPENNGYAIQIMNDGSITVTGTWTGSNNSVVGSSVQTKFNLPAGEYILNGANSNAFNNHGILLQGYDWTNSNILTTCTGADAPFTLSQETQVSVRLYINNSKATTPIPSEGIVLRPMIRLATEADDTYEPYSNICPIEGYDVVEVTRVGKNLLPRSAFPDRTGAGVTTTWMDDGTLHVSMTSRTAQNRWGLEGGQYVTHFTLPAGTYTIYRNLTTPYYGFRLYNLTDLGNLPSLTASQSDTETVNMTLTKTTDISCSITGNVGDTGEIYAKLGIYYANEYPSKWEPPMNDTYAISLAAAGGTVYSGELTLNEDGSGIIAIDRYYHEFDGTEYHSYIGTHKFLRWSGSEYPVGIIDSNGAGWMANTWSSHAKSSQITTSNSSIGAYAYVASGKSTYIQLRLPMFEEWTEEEASQYILDQYNAGTPITMGYTLNEPMIYPLTATQIQTLVGTNHVWTDAGEITLTYRSDKYAELERRISQLEALVLES